MLQKLLIFLVGVNALWAADHNTYKNCSRVEFCDTLRNRPASDDYSVDYSSILFTSSSTEMILNSNNGSPDLQLVLTGLESNTFRLQIDETDSSRYRLDVVLDGEPQTADIDQFVNDGYQITATMGRNTVIINFTPFNIEFGTDGTTSVIFEGNQLSFSQDNEPFTLGVSFPKAVQLYGLHEHCETLALKNTREFGDPYRLKNSDVGGFEIDSPMALYGAVPVLYGHGSDSTSGIFLHNAAEQWIDTQNGAGASQAYFMTETGSLDLFVLLGPTLPEVVRQYTKLTGTAYVPQTWTLGYHQSRYSYETQEDTADVAENFDSGNFQVDAIWLDIDYTDGKRYFTWNPDTYSDPLALQDFLASTSKKLVTIIDPHIKAEPGYNVYDGLLENDLFVKNADGSVFEGECWPGVSSYPDFLNPAARSFYGGMYSYENFPNSTSVIGGIWNDMNEPSVFDNSIEMTLPADSLHVGDVRHREIHNIYGFLHTMATHEGLSKRDDGQLRPFILTRSHFAGSQRVAAFWTGDNQARWSYLHASYKECLNANLLGLVFCGSDVGGFGGNPDMELLERWYQAGIWNPFFRAHSDKTTDRREPYLLPEESQGVVRDAIQLRYKHIPTWYTLFYEHNMTGDPIIRPLFYHYPQDESTFAIDDQLLVGRDIVVGAIIEAGSTTKSMYFPGGEEELWIDVHSETVQSGTGWVEVSAPREFSPVYYRRGGVIVRKDEVRQNTAGMVDDPHTLYYTPDDSGSAHGTAFLDDGQSFNYFNQGDFNYYNIDISGDSISVSNTDGNGNFDFVFNALVRRDIVVVPKDGKMGTYKETIITKDANGTPFKDLKVSPGKTMTIKLK